MSDPSPTIPSASPSPPPDDADIASTMGFSSFGAKPNPPKKKRKLADRTTPTTINTDENGSAGGSGSNTTPLGVNNRTATRTPGKPQHQQQQRRRPVGEDLQREQRPPGAETDNMGMGMLGRVQEQQRPAQPELRDDGTAPHSSPIRPDPDPDPLAAAAEALDDTAGMMPLETGLLPRGSGGGGPAASGGRPRLDDDGREWEEQRQGQDGEGDTMMMMMMKRERSRRQGTRDDGEWDWQALRRGVPDEKGDVAFYDASFVEDPWRGLCCLRGEG